MTLLRTALSRLLTVIVMVAAGLAWTTAGAQAAVPDRWGFALVDISSGLPDLTHQAGSWPAGQNVTVTPGSTGQVYVRFPAIGVSPERQNNGVPHVTAIADGPQYCQVQKYGVSGSDLLVAVQCYHYSGRPIFTPFSITFASSTGTLTPPGAFGYVYWTGAAIGSTYNSAGNLNVVSPSITPGVWTVDLPGIGPSTTAGNIQVTAVDSQRPAHCKASAWSPTWSGQKIQVRCFDAADAPLSTGWTLTYHHERAITGGAVPPRYFAYTFDNVPGNPGPYSPVPPGVSYNSVGSYNEIQTAGTGLRLVTFHKVGVLPDDVQVTAFGSGPAFCNLLAPWTTYGNEAIVRDVACYKGGTRQESASMVTYVSAR
ncbi:hypothetical protein Sme01_02400 [Sphaerisporangium melleum]|uniref:Secreted protein n=1 Tax=Sphaerisporangium melleum TaxID=321316 RepID=A0A917VK40_9ACTN|nr:hypothetical protein [Sphaerisporangium melleum]GGK89083.1 hypothetical protein GCM10007964_34730 [Sphaerisporangium melleum]GII67764.1 hypothetical protein Sme01_02400 [Sphaerisporangium melleum]